MAAARISLSSRLYGGETEDNFPQTDEGGLEEQKRFFGLSSHQLYARNTSRETSEGGERLAVGVKHWGRQQM